MEKVIRGDIFSANLGRAVGSEQSGETYVVIIQNNIGNKYSPTVIVAVVNMTLKECKLPTHISLSKKESGLDKSCIILTEQIRTIDKSRLIKKTGKISKVKEEELNSALKISLAL